MQGKRRGKKGPKEPTRPMVILPAGADMTTRPVAILSAKRDTDTETGESPSASAASRRPASTSAKLPASVPAKQAKGTSTKKQPVKAAKSVTPPTSKPSTPVPPSPTPVKSPWAHELVDSRFSFTATGSSLPSPLWQAANTQYRVIGALGTQGSGKSALLNALTVSTTSLNPVERARPFVERSRDEKCSIIHKTRGVKAAFCTVGGERVLLLDAQPVLSPSVLYDLVERQANLNLCSSHASLATLHDLQLAVFMLSVCDALFLVESDEDAQTRGLWKLLRFAYLAKGGDAIKDAVADLILVRNEMPMHKIDVAASLAREQELWMSFFSDIVPHAAPHPQLFFCPLASYGDSGLDAQSPEMAFLKHVLLNEIFSSTEHDHKLHEHQRLFGSSAATLHEGTPWWHAASFSDETDPIAAEDYDDFQNASTTHDWDTCPDVGEGFAHLHALLACRQRHPLLTQKSRGTKQSSLPPRMSETEWVDWAARLWLREIPHSIQLREFAVVCDGLLLST
ncbi:Protein SMG9 [Hondaea fermentalgiana]|uniref:Protein SMG9 n=1 Tax=Hondaea fermentalgiana TaxID=2315210 RepID=A0A2R5GKE2_9STRA|nr:Protein SMG9 [Hondaea fermentalgiana]|eukprot:GBG28751.1 Protein SMG9 [Hondaea fermentalgiana]